MTRCVLIVDDEEDICQIVQASLEEFGEWQTLVATSAVEGLELAQRQLPDLILLDASMPGMDGFAMFERLQGNPTTQGIPVILLTSKVMACDRKRFEAMSIVGVITKSFNPLTIWQRVGELLV